MMGRSSSEKKRRSRNMKTLSVVGASVLGLAQIRGGSAFHSLPPSRSGGGVGRVGRVRKGGGGMGGMKAAPAVRGVRLTALASPSEAMQRLTDKISNVGVEPVVVPVDQAASSAGSGGGGVGAGEMLDSYVGTLKQLLGQQLGWTESKVAGIPETVRQFESELQRPVIDAPLPSFPSSLGELMDGAARATEAASKVASAIASAVPDGGVQQLPSALGHGLIDAWASEFVKVTAALSSAGVSVERGEEALIIQSVGLLGIVFLGALTILIVGGGDGSRGGPDTRSLPTDYDLPRIMGYYNSRPAMLISRLVTVSSSLITLAIALYKDKKTGQWEANMPKRAEYFREFVQNAGPTYIKVGQGVSVRPDILPEPYLVELQKLQDQVSPFPDSEARAILEQQLGQPLSAIFEDVSAFDSPIAAASLGQVYKAKLRSNGAEVAVKVQRPEVLTSVTLDLYVIRIILQTIAKSDKYKESALSILGVIDNWAFRFIEELDYMKEAANGERFRSEMGASKTLGEAIIVPTTYVEYTSRYTLVSDWVNGVKIGAIDSSTEEGKTRLRRTVSTLVSAYLVQLLESGFLHADPHPGNFLCTPDGRLVILDFGLMQTVGEEQRVGLLRYVSNLLAKDYESTLDDLVTLGFIPSEITDDPAKAAIVAPLLGTVLEQLSNGGGANAITVESVGEEIEELGKQYPIVIPSYFGLIIRAFSALEGLGLTLDPGYSIVKECFPYLCRRLLTDESPPIQTMLRTFLYGKDGKYLNVDRVDELVDGYSQFTALAADASTPDAERAVTGLSEQAREQLGLAGDAPLALAASSSDDGGLLNDPVAKDALQLLFSKDGNYVQDLVVEEMVRMTDALTREVNLELIRFLQRLTHSSNPLSPGAVVRSLAEGPSLGPLMAPARMAAQLQTSSFDRLTQRLEVALMLDDDDAESLSALRRLVALFNKSVSTVATTADAVNGGLPSATAGNGSPSRFPLPPFMPPGEALANARRVRQVASLIGPGALVMGERFVVTLTSRLLARLAENLENSPAYGGVAKEEALAKKQRAFRA